MARSPVDARSPPSRHRATHGSLTGLANRDLLFDQTELMLRTRRRTGIVVVFIDLDWFKAINDRLGHRAGDQLLVHVAERLRATVRHGDVAARIGGRRVRGGRKGR